MLTENMQPGSRVLELGCGAGYFTRELAKTGASITAIDISPDLLAKASSDCTDGNVTFAAENAYQMSFGSESFDHVVGSSVLHHLEVKRALADCFRVLRPHGMLRFTEPNMLNPQIALQKNIPAIKRWLGDSEDETAFIRFLLFRELSATGFIDIRIVPFDFLHPKTPRILVEAVERMGLAAERIPLVREIAGSLFIKARKPG